VVKMLRQWVLQTQALSQYCLFMAAVL